MLHLHAASVGTDACKILDGLDVAIRPGSLVALVGPHGSGKSTALRVLGGDLTPSAGHVEIDGSRLDTLDPGRRGLARAVLTQERTSVPGFTGRDVVELGRFPHGFARRTRTARIVARALERTGATAYADRPYASLSKGAAARIDLARIVAQDAPLVLLDEPTRDLHPGDAYAIMRVVAQLADAGTTVVAAMSDLDLVAFFADRAIVLANGVAVADGLPQIVLNPHLLHRIFGAPSAGDRRRFRPKP